MIFVGSQTRFYIGRDSAVSPVAGQVFDLDTKIFGYLAPELRKVACLKHQHAIAGRKRVDDSRFPRARAGTRVDHHRTARLKDRAQAFQNLYSELREFGTAVVNDGSVDGSQNAVGNVRRTRDLKKVAAGVNHGCS